jgi:hypothetical protein
VDENCQKTASDTMGNCISGITFSLMDVSGGLAWSLQHSRPRELLVKILAL